MWLYGSLPPAARQIQSSALGGSAITPQLESLKPDRSIPLTTTAVTCGTGTLVPVFSKPLASFDDPIDTKITSARGNVGSTQTDETEIFGEESVAGIGTAIPGNTQALTTSASTCGIGTLAPRLTITELTVMAASLASPGTLVYVVESQGDVTVDLNAGEMEMVGLAGSVRPTNPITNLIITSAAGTHGVANTPTDPLLGMASTCSLGTMASNQDVEDTFITSSHGVMAFVESFALTGTEAIFSTGNVTDTEDITLALTGEEDVCAAGSVGFSNEYALTGAESIGEQYFVGAPGYGFPEGAESIVSAGTMFDGDDRDYPLTGEQATFENRILGVSTFTALFNDNIGIVAEQFLFEKEEPLTGEAIIGEQGRPRVHGKRDAGKPKPPKPPKKPKKVVVDGQVFEVDDEEQLKDLIAVAKEIAKEQAAALVAEQVAAKSKDKIKLKVPKVEGSEELKDAIADIYMQATIDAEVSRNRQLDEEEALVLLLLN